MTAFIPDPEAPGAKAQLAGRFLAGGVEDVTLARPGGDRRRDLQEQRRLADPRLTPEEDHRTADEASAEHPVELADAERPTRCGSVGRRPGERLGNEGRRGPRCGPPVVDADDGLDQGVPLVTGFALSSPPNGGCPT